MLARNNLIELEYRNGSLVDSEGYQVSDDQLIGRKLIGFPNMAFACDPVKVEERIKREIGRKTPENANAYTFKKIFSMGLSSRYRGPILLVEYYHLNGRP